MYNFQSPAEMERMALAQLEARCQELLAYLHTYPSNQRYSPTQLETILRTLAQYEQVFMSFSAQAQQLNMSGYPQLAQRLNFVMNDFRNTCSQYQQMYQGAAQSQQNWMDIWAKAQSEALKNTQEANQYSQSSFNAWQQDTMAINEERCQYCGRYIGTHDGICPDCERKRRLAGL